MECVNNKSGSGLLKMKLHPLSSCTQYHYYNAQFIFVEIGALLYLAIISHFRK